MSRYRLLPTFTQQAALRDHCAHARYVWNLAVEQHSHWHPGRRNAPGYLEQCRQLTAARAENPWLAAGSQMVQQQALRDFAGAMAAFLDPHNPARRPTWRKAGRDEGFRIVGRRGRQWDVRRLSRLLHAPGLTKREQRHLLHLKRKFARAKRGSNRRKRVRLAIARLCAREADRRKDWTEKASTDIARRFDVICIEDLKISNMTRSARATLANPGRNIRAKAGLNRQIMRSGWGLLVRRLDEKASGRVEKVKPQFTSQRCSACGCVDRTSRESQARFVCTACGFACNADMNAARNIAAGHAVTARGGDGVARPVNREPHLLAS
jgi:putative transposase